MTNNTKNYFKVRQYNYQFLSASNNIAILFPNQNILFVFVFTIFFKHALPRLFFICFAFLLHVLPTPTNNKQHNNTTNKLTRHNKQTNNNTNNKNTTQQIINNTTNYFKIQQYNWQFLSASNKITILFPNQNKMLFFLFFLFFSKPHSQDCFSFVVHLFCMFCRRRRRTHMRL